MTLRQGFDPKAYSLTLRATGLACRRGERVLVAGLDFTVGPGRALLLKGPNGAGKTTLLLTLYGAISPAAGSFTIEGIGTDELSTAFMHLFGHQSAVKPRLSVTENVHFWASVNGGGDVESALETVGLGSIAHLDAGYLSAGQTRRLAWARLLVSPRPIWLLDEPTSALDSDGDAMVAALIDAHLDAGGLAIAATHLPLNLRDPARVSELRIGPA